MPKQHTHSSAAGSGEKQERVLNLYKVKRWLKVTQVWIGGDCSECRVTERGRTGKCYFRVYMFCGWSFTTLEPGKNWCLTTWGIVKIVLHWTSFLISSLRPYCICRDTHTNTQARARGHSSSSLFPCCATWCDPQCICLIQAGMRHLWEAVSGVIQVFATLPPVVMQPLHRKQYNSHHIKASP